MRLSKRVQTEVSTECKVQQQFRETANINSIMRKALKARQMPLEFAERANKGFYGDFTGMDFRAIQERMIEAKESFMRLPSEIRKRFGHSPANLVEFMENPENKVEAQKLGLLPPDKPAADKPAAPAAPSAT